MSVFNDEDLKFFKAYMSEPECKNTQTGSAFLRLIARLEAAEAVIEWQDKYDQTFDVQEEVSYTPLSMLESSKTVWRKAAGKERE